MLKLVAVLAAAAVTGLVATPSATPRQAGTISACAHYAGHLYEACFAYVVNDSGKVLRKFYAEGHSADTSQAGDALEDFHYRYRGQARSLVAQRVAKWPKGRNIVAVPRITIIKASSSLVNNTAQLTTRETWRVTTTSGKVLYAENNRLHDISMRRVQGKLLHIWVVTSIS